MGTCVEEGFEIAEVEFNAAGKEESIFAVLFNVLRTGYEMKMNYFPLHWPLIAF